VSVSRSRINAIRKWVQRRLDRGVRPTPGEVRARVMTRWHDLTPDAVDYLVAVSDPVVSPKRYGEENAAPSVSHPFATSKLVRD
jgi:hypothetical protein